MKTLILDAARPAQLLLDGPSLVLAAAESAPRRFPFTRLGRVLVGGRVACHAAALAACLEQGIPVTFLGSGGCPAGVAVPFSAETPRIAGMLEDFVALPVWRTVYSDWKRAAERREILDVLRHWPLRLPDLRPMAVHAALGAEIFRRIPAAQVERWRAAATALITSRISLRLAHGRMGGALPALDGIGLRLIPDFASILIWRFYADCRSWLEADPEALAGHWKPRLAALVEARAARDDARIQSLWDRFRFWIAGVV